MNISTKTGDGGETSLFGGRRVPKNHIRVDAYGTVDELNAHIGVVRSLAPEPGLERILDDLQHRLFVLGADLARPHRSGEDADRIGQDDINALEEAIGNLEGLLPPLKNFILPSGTPVAAQLHVARTVCRRAERIVAALAGAEAIGPHPLIFLNRLSDLLFLMARHANSTSGKQDVPWKKR